MSAHDQPATEDNTGSTLMQDMSQSPGAFSAVDYDPFANAASIARVVPTTEAQREIWLACQLGADASMAYNESVSVRLQGHDNTPLDAEALRCALGKLVARHDALRATFGADGQEMFIAETLALDMREYDISALTDEQREIALQRHIRADVDTPFNLEQGPLLRAQLIELRAFDAVLVLTAHHIVCDGWSFGVLLRDLGGLYAQAMGRPATLIQPGSFADFSQALLAREATPEYASDEAYWLTRYRSTPPVLDLPLDYTRPPQRRFASQRIDHTLPADLIEQVRRLGGSRGSSFFSTLLTAFAALLQRLSGAEEVVVGVPAAGQTLPGFEHTVGHGVNLLPLRLSPDPADPLASAVGTVQSDVLDAFEHQHYTFGTLLKRLIIEREPSRVPLASVMFNLDQALELDTYPGLRASATSNPRLFENFELFVNAVPEHGALRLESQYAASLFSATTVSRWLECFETLLRQACAQQAAPLAQLDITSAADQQQLVVNNATAVPLPGELLVHRWLLAQSGVDPAATALVHEDGTLTYAALWQQAHRIARTLRARGAAVGTRVGLCLPRDADMLPTMLGAMLSGAAYVPLDPNFPSRRLVDMAEDAQLTLLVTHSSVADALPWPRAHSLWLDADAATIAAQPDTPLAPDATLDAQPESPAYLIYTSGSTGKPKGVLVPHRAVVNFLFAVMQRPGLTASDRLLAVTTLSFDIAVLELMLPLATGASIVLATREQASDGNALRQLLETERVTVLQATPSTWRLLLGAGWGGAQGFKALVGGEALPTDLAQQLLGVCSEVWNMYGPTETTVWSTCWRVQAPETGVSIGSPLANTQVWIGDTYGRPCPLGVPGEILIGGAGVALGYWQRPDLTAERFIPDTFSGQSGAALYRTGDCGRWRHDGLLEHLGRLDFQVKLRGFRIELGDIESHLANHPAVSQVVALVREDVPGDARLVAYFVPKSDQAEPSAAALRDHLKASLPAYMLPQHFVPLPMLPLLPNGKIDRKNLPAPATEPRGDAPSRVAPRTTLEQIVLDTMEQVLKLPGMSVLDDFFVLGGHSLLVAQLIAQLSHKLNFNLPFRAVFESPTAERLALTIQQIQTNGEAPRIAIRHDPSRKVSPLTAQQERIAFMEELYPDRVLYNTPSAHRLHGPLNLRAFEKALSEMVQRQPILRTWIRTTNGMHEQVVQDAVDIAMPLEDLSALPASEREIELLRRMQERVDTSIDIHEAPLFRTALYKLGPQEHAFLFMPHHIIWDGWSFDLLYTEMAACYAAISQGAPSRLPTLQATYADYAHWQSEWVQSAAFNRQLRDWNARLAKAPMPKALNTDKPRSAGMSGEGSTEWVHIDKPTTERLRDVARQSDVTLNMLTLAIYGAMMASLAASSNIVIGVPVRGRMMTEIEPVMGFFNNLLPMQVQIDPDQPVADFLRVVKQELLEVMNFHDVPLERLAMEPDMMARSQRAGIYQALFSFQDARERTRQWGDLTQSAILIFQKGATEDLGLWLMEVPSGLEGGFTYNADIYTAQTAAAFRERYLELIDRLASDPQQSLSKLLDLNASAAAASLSHLAATTAPLARAASSTPATAGHGLMAASQPLTGTEQALADVWSSLLGLQPEQVRVQDNYFDLGGDSLTAMRAVIQMYERTGKRVNANFLIYESLGQIGQRYDDLSIDTAGEAKADGKAGLVKRLFGVLGRSKSLN